MLKSALKGAWHGVANACLGSLQRYRFFHVDDARWQEAWQEHKELCQDYPYHMACRWDITHKHNQRVAIALRNPRYDADNIALIFKNDAYEAEEWGLRFKDFLTDYEDGVFAPFSEQEAAVAWISLVHNGRNITDKSDMQRWANEKGYEDLSQMIMDKTSWGRTPGVHSQPANPYP